MSLDRAIEEARSAVKVKSATIERTKKLQEMSTLCDPQRMSQFRLRTLPYLTRYAEIKSIPREVDIATSDIDATGKQIYIPTELDFERIDAIVKYLTIASEYVPVTFHCTGYKPSNIASLCHSCGYNLCDYFSLKSITVECPFCAKVCHLSSRAVTKKMNKCSQTHYNSEYEDLSTFVKCIDYFQGKIVPRVDLTRLKFDLDEYFTEIEFKIGEVIKMMPLTEDGKRGDSNIEMMVNALKAKGYNCYDEIYFICNWYWGWKPHNISHLSEMLSTAFIKVQHVWQTMTVDERGRKSNIPARLILCELLRIYGYKCSRRDFKLPKNIEKYRPAWKKMCDQCGDPQIYFIDD